MNKKLYVIGADTAPNFDTWEEWGEYFGYPQCCIDSFCENPGFWDANQSAVHNGHGFKPCPAHAKMIVEGKITLESLIVNRVCPTPFPHYKH